VCNKSLIFSVKKFTFNSFIWNWKYFLQLFSKLLLKHVVSFMNRKSSCGYATLVPQSYTKSFKTNTDFLE
jgi:hypothetical protein